MATPFELPLQQSERLVSLDIIRGVALFGILLMNITAFGLPNAYSDPTVYGGAQGADLWAWWIITMFFEGTQRGLFSLLFGAGVILLTSRLEARGGESADIYFRRNLWLVVFGVVHGFVLLWTGEILFYYGVTALFVYAFRNAQPRTLLAVALAGLLFNAAWNLADARAGIKLHAQWQQAEAAKATGAELTHEQSAAADEWRDLVADMKPDAGALQATIDAKRGSYFTVMRHQAPELVHNQSWWLYRYFFDIFSMMLIGMAAFRLGLLQLGHARKPYYWMIGLGYGIGLPVNYMETSHLLASDFSILSRLQVEVSYDVGRLAMTSGHLGMLMLFCNANLLGWLKRRLAAVGQMALSNYISHSIICAFVFYGFGLALFGQLARHQLYYLVFAIWIFQLIVSPIWLARFRFGPLEWLWRSLTYGRRQPMRRGAASGQE
ncbi:MAG: DUF418 domain-containing protein [Arenimonas sp.]|nr:DUF418 domain-containing protein [Arenimonas sp.]MBP6626397.1 DUF418 domain-containing protein [Arenimonas sp.]